MPATKPEPFHPDHGYRTIPPGYVQGAPRPDPFAGDKPLFSITAKNFRDYGDQLPDGAKHLFEKYPDYRMDIYPSHRSAAAPDWVYDNIFRNATNAHAASEGIVYGVAGAVGGIPFPIPGNGYEAMWNHLLAFWGPAREVTVGTYVVSADGTIDKATTYRGIADFLHIFGARRRIPSAAIISRTVQAWFGPAGGNRPGLSQLAADQYPTLSSYSAAAARGTPRPQGSLSISYDVPDPDAAGFVSMDEYYLFYGGLDHYDFKLLGKKEMYVPYNNNRLYLQPARAIMGPSHANPDALRYELHRVWVVEGTLAKGQHDIVAKRRLYLDEDSWFALWSDSWDEQGKIVGKFGQAYHVSDA